MAQIATVDQPVSINTVATIGSTTQANRFPVPPSAAGFGTDVDELVEWVSDGLGPPYIIFGSLNPESDFLEPTRGQIWPRIG